MLSTKCCCRCQTTPCNREPLCLQYHLRIAKQTLPPCSRSYVNPQTVKQSRQQFCSCGEPRRCTRSKTRQLPVGDETLELQEVCSYRRHYLMHACVGIDLALLSDFDCCSIVNSRTEQETHETGISFPRAAVLYSTIRIPYRHNPLTQLIGLRFHAVIHSRVNISDLCPSCWITVLRRIQLDSNIPNPK